MDVLFEWFYSFVYGCQYVWDWLISEYDFLGMSVRPIFLLVGATLIIGLVRAIL